MTQMISIKDTRNKLADIVDQVAFGENVFVITKFGKPRAMLVPVSKKQLPNSSKIADSFGAWGSRKDIKDSNKWVEEIRAKMNARNE